MNISRTHILTVLAASAASIGIVAGPALASNAHFVKAAADVSGSGISVSFKEAGLGSGSVETIRASADYTAVFQCVNGGGKNPSAANKSTETGSSAASGTFHADKNGNVAGTLSIAAPSVVDNDLVCPKGQREQLSQLTWSGIHLDDLTSGASASFSGSFNYGSVL